MGGAGLLCQQGAARACFGDFGRASSAGRPLAWPTEATGPESGPMAGVLGPVPGCESAVDPGAEAGVEDAGREVRDAGSLADHRR